MIDIERARELLKQAVETQGPDFVYARPGMTCYYEKITPNHPDFHEMEENDNRCVTGCIVGVALDLAGETFHHGYQGSILYLAGANTHKITYDAGGYLRVAQIAQDSGMNWGFALAKAERWYEYNKSMRMRVVYS